MEKLSFTIDLIVDSGYNEGAMLEFAGKLMTAAKSVASVDSHVRLADPKSLSEQGYKVWRGRVKGLKQKPVRNDSGASQKYLEGQLSLFGDS